MCLFSLFSCLLTAVFTECWQNSDVFSLFILTMLLVLFSSFNVFVLIVHVFLISVSVVCFHYLPLSSHSLTCCSHCSVICSNCFTWLFPFFPLFVHIILLCSHIVILRSFRFMFYCHCLAVCWLFLCLFKQLRILSSSVLMTSLAVSVTWYFVFIAFNVSSHYFTACSNTFTVCSHCITVSSRDFTSCSNCLTFCFHCL